VKRLLLFLAVTTSVVLLMATPACGGGTEAPVAAETPKTSKPSIATEKELSAGKTHDVAFTTDGSTFTGPTTGLAGWTRFTLTNQGPDRGHMAVIKLTGGKTVADFISFIQQNSDSPLPEWALGYGGPGPVDAGATSVIITQLDEGDYALVRYVTDDTLASRPDPGSVQPYTVTPSTDMGTAPESTAYVELFDYGIIVQREERETAGISAFTMPLDTGLNVVEVVNKGPQTHEVRFLELGEGKEVSDSPGWTTGVDSSSGGKQVFRSLPEIAEDGTGPSSPPIGKAVGGLMALRPGGTAYVSIYATPSNYFAYDTLINAETGESMVLAYMVQRFQVIARRPGGDY